MITFDFKPFNNFFYYKSFDLYWIKFEIFINQMLLGERGMIICLLLIWLLYMKAKEETKSREKKSGKREREKLLIRERERAFIHVRRSYTPLMVFLNFNIFGLMMVSRWYCAHSRSSIQSTSITLPIPRSNTRSASPAVPFFLGFVAPASCILAVF